MYGKSVSEPIRELYIWGRFIENIQISLKNLTFDSNSTSDRISDVLKIKIFREKGSLTDNAPTYYHNIVNTYTGKTYSTSLISIHLKRQDKGLS